MFCLNDPDGITCGISMVAPVDPLNVEAIDGVRVIPNEPITRLEDAEIGLGERPTVADDPSRGEPLVIANQSGNTVNDNAITQINWCRAFGGKENVGSDMTPAGGYKFIDVMCVGGLLGGMVCVNQPGYMYCFAPVRPEAGIRVTPTGGIEADSEIPAATTAATEVSSEPTAVVTEPSMEPTVAATDVPLEPTAAPTELPVEPTAAPTEEPSLPENPIEDEVVPPGEAEDPTRAEPTPTEVVLQ